MSISSTTVTMHHGPSLPHKADALWRSPDGGRLSCADDKVVGHLLLQHEPHAVDVVAGMAPVAPRVQVPQQQAFLLARCQ